MTYFSAHHYGPDLVLYNGRVITLDQNSRIAEALAVKNNRISAIGTSKDVLGLATEYTQQIDLQGRAVIPGLNDGHAHMDREGLKGIFPSMGKVSSIQDVLDRIAELVKVTPPGEWIVTMPLGTPPAYADMPDSLEEKRFPTRYDLDKVAPDNPVYIRAIWGFWRHTLPLISIANSKALELAGIFPDTPSPSPYVNIEKDDAGLPTGIFREDTLMPIVELTFFRSATRFPLEKRRQSVPYSIQAYHAYGTTSVFEGHGVASEVLQSYKDAHAVGHLHMRVGLVLSPNWKSVPGVEFNAFLEAWCGGLSGQGLGDDYLRLAGIFVDCGRDAANDLRAQAYPNTGWAGFNYDTGNDRERTLELLFACAQNRIQVVAIWPNMLELFYETHKRIPLNNLRWVLGHISVLSPREIAMIAEMGLIVTTHTNRYLYKEGHLLQQRLRPDQEQDIVPLRSLIDAGVRVVLATDNVPVSMFPPIWQSVARVSRTTGSAIGATQKITREEALRCASAHGAWLTWDEEKKGTLEPGKLADFAVLDQDPLLCSESHLKDIQAVMTVIDGRIVYQAPSF